MDCERERRPASSWDATELVRERERVRVAPATICCARRFTEPARCRDAGDDVRAALDDDAAAAAAPDDVLTVVELLPVRPRPCTGCTCKRSSAFEDDSARARVCGELAGARAWDATAGACPACAACGFDGDAVDTVAA
jgi:hypothetical protein